MTVSVLKQTTMTIKDMRLCFW